MKSTLKCTQTLSKVTFYSKSGFIVDALRFCVFTLYFGLNLFKCLVVSLTDQVLLLALSSTFYSILKLQFTHYLLSLWMQRFLPPPSPPPPHHKDSYTTTTTRTSPILVQYTYGTHFHPRRK